MTEYDLTLHVPVHSSLYEVLQLEARREDYDLVEDCIRSILYQHINKVHHEQFRQHVTPPVGVSDEAAERMQLMAEFRRDAGSDRPWHDTVGEFLGLFAEPLDEGHEEVRPEWVDDYGDAE